MIAMARSVVVSMLGCCPGDRWFESRRPSFAKNADFFMIFVLYLRSIIDRSLAGKL